MILMTYRKNYQRNGSSSSEEGEMEEKGNGTGSGNAVTLNVLGS